MHISVIPSYKNAHEARGLTIVIDVFTSFTTACYLTQNNASIVLAESIDAAYTLKKKHPDWLLVGGDAVLPPCFDCLDSPSEVEQKDFTGKTVVLVTRAGTRGILRATHADEIITASFVNVGAVIDYVRKRRPSAISLVCTEERYMYNEDLFCASYIKNTLEGHRVDFAAIRHYLTSSSTIRSFLHTSSMKTALRDFTLCLERDRFDFVLRAKRGRHNLLLMHRVELADDRFDHAVY